MVKQITSLASDSKDFWAFVFNCAEDAYLSGHGQETSARMLINSERYILHRLLIEFNRHDQDSAFRLGKSLQVHVAYRLRTFFVERKNLLDALEQSCYE